MHITQLTAENVKRLSAVSITPDGNVVVIGGDNDQGKSTVLDSIMYALAGGDSHPEVPVRRGEDKGVINLKLSGDESKDLPPMTVTRIFNAAKKTTSLTVKAQNAAGSYAVTSPQKLLDSLCGRIAFDPLEFSRAAPKAQAETLRGLVGLDFTEANRKRESLYGERTEVNRKVKHAKAQLEAKPFHEDAPVDEVLVADLMTELQKRQQHNREDEAVRETLALHKTLLTEAVDQLETLSAQLDRVKVEIRELQETINNDTIIVDGMADADDTEILQQIAAADDTNAKVRSNTERQAIVNAIVVLEPQAEQLTRDIAAVDADKAKQMADAEWPVDGLGFDEQGGVTLNELPFEQSGQAEQLRVSVAMGLALNPTLRVLLIRDGSLLDDTRMEMIAQLAADNDAQLWIERVGTDGPATVIIEDGHIKD